MNQKRIIFLLIIALVVSNLIALNFLFQQKNNQQQEIANIRDDVISELVMRGNRGNHPSLIHLHDAIDYQIKQSWANPYHATVMVENTLQSLITTIQIVERTGWQTSEEKRLLNKLYDDLNDIQTPLIPYTEISDDEKRKLIKLRNSLKLGGWDEGSYSSDWDEFIERIAKMYDF